MQAAQSQNPGYHGHPHTQPTGYVNGAQQSYRPDQQPSNGTSPTSDMYPYQQHPHYQQPQPQPQQQHPQQQPYPQQHPQHAMMGYPQPGLRPMYPGMMAPGGLPPLQHQHPGMLPNPHAPMLSGPMPGTIPSQQPMYGAPQPMVQQAPRVEPRPLTVSGIKGDYRYELIVAQQPQRARMCGFGDKDRRPITPPPCIKLVITHKDTGEEIDHKSIDGSFFVLQVDLWDKEATREVNIVRASATSPAVSISTATTTSYPPPAERTMDYYGMPNYGTYYDPQTGTQYMPHGAVAGGGYMPGAPTPATSTTLYTRNLIGSLTVNASSLQDVEKKDGFWFVLQDLSVRTEGFFRLKMNFIDVGDLAGGPGLNRGRCPVLASVYSEPFQVFSAKKFPGVIESTPLSKAFASQGIKIPIRKEGGKADKDDDDE